ncbi:hypothetical protein TKK_0017580 [Trichogramma kaykai]
MSQYNKKRKNPFIASPRVTRYRSKKIREPQSSTDSDDSSSILETCRLNEPVARELLKTVRADTDSEEYATSNELSPESLLNAAIEHEQASPVIDEVNSPMENDNYSSDNSQFSNNILDEINNERPVISDSSDTKDEDQYRRAWEFDVREEILEEQDDINDSEDDYVYQDLKIEAGAFIPQNPLNDLLQKDDAIEIIPSQVRVSVPEILLAVLKYSLIHNLSQTAISDLFKMLNLFLSTSLLPQSRYLVDKLFNAKEYVQYHALCPKCKLYITEFDRDNDFVVQCIPCNYEFSIKDPTYFDYFVTINQEKEIARDFEENWFHYELVKARRKENSTSFRDIYDGVLYKQLRNSLPNNKKKIIL